MLATQITRQVEDFVMGCAVGQSRFNLTTHELDQAQARLMDYPLPQVEYRLREEGVIPAHLVDEAIREYRRFLTVVLVADGPVGMISPTVDEVWHAHILHTKDYTEFCDEIFGTTVHHAPNWPGAILAKGGGRRFVKFYRKLFGKLPLIWKGRVDDEGAEECTPTYDCNGGSDNDCSSQ